MFHWLVRYLVAVVLHFIATYKKLYLEGGEDALRDVSRKKPNIKNQVLPHISEAVLSLSLEHPEFGNLRASNELRNRGILVSSSGVRGI